MSTETKASFKTTELIAHVASVLGVLTAAASPSPEAATATTTTSTATATTEHDSEVVVRPFSRPVLRGDTRGQGESALPSAVDRKVSFALPDLAQDFFAVIDDVSPTEPVHGLAHDWGSIQVWEAVYE